jgi:hypothetical protein
VADLLVADLVVHLHCPLVVPLLVLLVVDGLVVVPLHCLLVVVPLQVDGLVLLHCLLLDALVVLMVHLVVVDQVVLLHCLVYLLVELQVEVPLAVLHCLLIHQVHLVVHNLVVNCLLVVLLVPSLHCLLVVHLLVACLHCLLPLVVQWSPLADHQQGLLVEPLLVVHLLVDRFHHVLLLLHYPALVDAGQPLCRVCLLWRSTLDVRPCLLHILCNQRARCLLLHFLVF